MLKSPTGRRLLIVLIAALFGIMAVGVAVGQATSSQPSKKAPSDGAAGSAQQAGDAPKPPASGGLLVFIDPATGRVVQPNESDIRKLSVTHEPGVAVKSQEQFIQGPGNAVGVRLDPSSFSYAVATRAPDGKIALDCVTDESAANSQVQSGASGNSAVKPKPRAASDEK